MERALGRQSDILGSSPNSPANSLCDLGQIPFPLWALVTLAEPEVFGDDDPRAVSPDVLGV